MTETSSIVTSSAFSEVVSAITGQISVSTIMGVLASAVPIAAGMVFAWWGLRKVTRIIMGAFRKGKLNP